MEELVLRIVGGVLGGVVALIGVRALKTGKLSATVLIYWLSPGVKGMETEEQRPTTARITGGLLVALGLFVLWRALFGEGG